MGLTRLPSEYSNYLWFTRQELSDASAAGRPSIDYGRTVELPGPALSPKPANAAATNSPSKPDRARPNNQRPENPNKNRNRSRHRSRKRRPQATKSS